MIVLLCILVIFLFIYFRFFKGNYKFKFDAVSFFEGSLGSGKTTMLTYCAIRELKKRIRRNRIIKIINLFIPIKSKKLKLHGTNLYSNYPIYISKKLGYSIVVNFQVLQWLHKVNEDCIICLDEVSYLFPKEMKMTDPRTKFCITWLRHATNCLLLCASQSLSECNITFRSKVCKVFHLTDCKCGLFKLSHVYVREAIISEDMSNVYTDDPDKDNCFKFIFPVKHFASRYARYLYDLESKYIDILSYDYDKLLLAMGKRNGENWDDLYWRFERYKENLKLT